MLDGSDNLVTKLSLNLSSTHDAEVPLRSARARRPKTPRKPKKISLSPPRQTAGTSRTNNQQSLSFSLMSIISPRSATYDRLENGLSPPKKPGRSWQWWKKALLGATILLFLLWLLRSRRPDIHIPFSNSPTNNAHPAVTHATDTNPSLTTHCTTPHTAGKPLVQYALIIDAGSTGSRIHIYKFNNCYETPFYEYEVFRQIHPGLSKFAKAKDPEGGAKSLDELMDEAMRVVPESMRRCTPLGVKATAGLRQLEQHDSDAVLAAVEHRLKTKYPFPVKDVVVMDGKEEGVYAWITVNYLLNTIASPNPQDSYAVLDLGGASTQIVFKPNFLTRQGMEEGDHKYSLAFHSKQHILYQHSYLGYGLMSARQSIHRLVGFMDSIRPDTGGPLIYNPCINRGASRLVEIQSFSAHDQGVKDGRRNVTMSGKDVGSFEGCRRVVELVLAKDAICHVHPCSFNGVYQPSILDTFPKGKILLLSYFYDRITPLLPPSSSTQPKLTISTIAKLAKDMCDGPPYHAFPLTPNSELEEDIIGRPEYCLDLTFIYVLLRLGYEFGDEREVELGKKIDGTEVGWCLGAVLAELVAGGELKCLA